MLTTLKDEFGLCFAVCEWEIVNKDGQFQEGGEYCYVQDCWIHPYYIRSGTLKRIIKMIDIHDFMLNVKWVYWAKLNQNGKIKMFDRKKLANKGE